MAVRKKLWSRARCCRGGRGTYLRATTPRTWHVNNLFKTRPKMADRRRLRNPAVEPGPHRRRLRPNASPASKKKQRNHGPLIPDQEALFFFFFLISPETVFFPEFPPGPWAYSKTPRRPFGGVGASRPATPTYTALGAAFRPPYLLRLRIAPLHNPTRIQGSPDDGG